MEFKKQSFETLLSIVAIFLAVGWVVLPEAVLEPLIVLVLLLSGFVPIYQHQIRPSWDAYRLKKQGFKYLKGSKPLNAIEGDFANFSNGIKFELQSQSVPNFPIYAQVFFEQTQLRLVVHFNNGDRVDLNPSFNVGNDSDGEVIFPKRSNHYVLAQFDLNADGFDEVIFGVIESLEFESRIHMLVFEYHPPFLERDVARFENWQVYGAACAVGVNGDPVIHLERGTISIPRNFRSMEYKWSFIDNQQVYVGSA